MRLSNLGTKGKGDKSVKGKVAFKHFIGIAARRYIDLFSMKLGRGYDIKRKDKHGKTLPFIRKDQKVRVHVPSTP